MQPGDLKRPYRLSALRQLGVDLEQRLAANPNDAETRRTLGIVLIVLASAFFIPAVMSRT